MLGCAIICEYNPFHRGHERQITELRARRPDVCVTAVIAGGFVQRGEPAVLSKYDRARAALDCGVDLAVELPFPWSAQGAAYYARAGVAIAAGIGCKAICFGSETGDLPALKKAASRLGSGEFEAELSRLETNGMQTSLSHIGAIRATYLSIYGEELPLGSNDTLALEYLRAITITGVKLDPLCVKREGGYTASAARKSYRAGDMEAFSELVPERVLSFYKKRTPVSSGALDGAILSFLRTRDPGDFAEYADLGGGIAERLNHAAAEASGYSDFTARAATKKYTDSRLRRAVLSAMLGVREDDVCALPAYTTLLAANERGTAFLAENRKTAAIPVVTRPSYGEKYGARQYELSSRADALWATAAGESPADQIRRSPYIIREKDR